MIDLIDKKILGTGASDGIGKGIANYLMKKGAQVAVHYNTNKKSAEALVSLYKSTQSKVFQADLAYEENVFQLFKEVEQFFDKIDVIILNAGVFLQHSTNINTKDWLTIWKKTMDINLNSVGLLTKLGIDHFIKNV